MSRCPSRLRPSGRRRGAAWRFVALLALPLVMAAAADPFAPDALVVTPVSATSVTLSWTDNAPDETGWVVQRTTGATPGVWADHVSVGATTTTDAGLTIGTRYWYRVRAVRPGGDTGYDESVAIAPITDSGSFSTTTQGFENWRYGFYDDGTYALWTEFIEYSAADGTWSMTPDPANFGYCMVGDDGFMHPGALDQSVRRWTAPADGGYLVAGELRKVASQLGGNGVTGRIRRNGTLLWSGTIAGGDAVGVTYRVAVDCAAGDVLDLALDAIASDQGLDSTIFSAAIAQTGLSLTSVSPPGGPVTGGTAITVRGRGFTGSTTLTIDGDPITALVVVDASTITATTPAGLASGLVAVVARDGDDQIATLASGFYYQGTTATITGLDIVTGTWRGGTAVTLTGTGFVAPATLTFDGVAATSVVVVDPTTITAVTPRGDPASPDLVVDLALGNGDYQTATQVGGFTYTLRPADAPPPSRQGLLGEYYQSGGPTLPDFSLLTPASTRVWTTAIAFNGVNADEPARNDFYSRRWTGYITVPSSGIYEFYTASDDGTRLSIGGNVIVANDYSQPTTERSGYAALQAGPHALLVEYAQGNGNHELYLSWRTPGGAKQTIPASVLSTPRRITTWTNGAASGLWSVAGNWDDGVPDAEAIAVFGVPSDDDCAIDVPAAAVQLDVTAAYAGTISHGADAVAVGALGWSQAGGAFAGGTGAITVADDLAITAGAFTAPTTTLTILGDLTLAGTSFTAPAGTLTVAGDLVRSAGAFVHNGGRVVLTGSDTATLTCAQPFADLRVDKANGDMIGHWRLDDGAGTNVIDSSPRGNDGTLIGGAWSAATASGIDFANAGSLTFAGDGSRVVHGGPLFSDVVDDFTMAFWGNPDATRNGTGEGNSGITGTSGQRYAIFPRQGDVYGGGGRGAGVSVGTNGVSVFEHAGSHLPSPLVHDTPISGWTHIVVTYTARVPRLYLDGVLVRTGLVSLGPIHPSENLGDDGSGYGRYSGGLDDVRIYDRVLTVGEITTLAAGSELGSRVTLGAAITVGGDLELDSGEFDAGAFAIDLAGDWQATGGEFLPGTGTVTLSGGDQAITGSTTFRHLTKTVAVARTLTFAPGGTQTVLGALTLQGAVGNRLSLRCTTPGTAWLIDPQGARACALLDVQDGLNLRDPFIQPSSSLNSGGNARWFGRPENRGGGGAIGAPSIQ